MASSNSMSLNLTAEEQAGLAPLEAQFSEQARRPISLHWLIAAWENLVEELEGGYADETIDDYTNDLTTRDLIETARTSAPDSLKTKLDSVVAPLDERFRRSTIADDSGVIRQHFTPGSGWWWSRIPPSLAEQ